MTSPRLFSLVRSGGSRRLRRVARVHVVQRYQLPFRSIRIGGRSPLQIEGDLLHQDPDPSRIFYLGARENCRTSATLVVDVYEDENGTRHTDIVEQESYVGKTVIQVGWREFVLPGEPMPLLGSQAYCHGDRLRFELSMGGYFGRLGLGTRIGRGIGGGVGGLTGAMGAVDAMEWILSQLRPMTSSVSGGMQAVWPMVEYLLEFLAQSPGGVLATTVAAFLGVLLGAPPGALVGRGVGYVAIAGPAARISGEIVLPFERGPRGGNDRSLTLHQSRPGNWTPTIPLPTVLGTQWPTYQAQIWVEREDDDTAWFRTVVIETTVPSTDYGNPLRWNDTLRRGPQGNHIMLTREGTFLVTELRRALDQGMTISRR
jgi:hypothetical protein